MIRFIPPLFRTLPVALALAVAPVLAADPADDPAAVVVTATRQATRANEVIADVTVIDREAIERHGAGNITSLLARQPGMQTSSLGGPGSQTEFIVRGARSEQTKILVDGISFNSMDVRGSPLRFVSLDDVERIEILRGPAGAVHGSDAIGGVIQIFTRKPKAGIHGEITAGIGAFGAEKLTASVSYANRQVSARLFVGDHRSDGFSSVRNATNRDADADGFRNRSSGLTLAFRPTTGHELTFSGFANRGQAQFDGSTGAGTFDSRYTFRNEVWSVTSANQLTKDWLSTFRWGHSIDEQVSYTSAAAAGYSPLISTSRSLTWQNDLKLPLGKALLVVENQDQLAAPPNRFPTNRFAQISALQIGWTGSANRHRWQLGIRRDIHTQFGTATTGVLSYGYQFAETWRVHAALATTFRAPTLYQLFVSIPGSLVPNPNLRPEQARNYELGVTRELGLGTGTIIAFDNRVRDMIDYNVATTSYRNISKARLRGWSLAWKDIRGSWTYGANLDFLSATDGNSGLHLGRRAAGVLNLNATWQTADWEVGGEWQVVGRRYNRDDETQPMAGYALLNVSVRKQIDRFGTIELRIDNLDDRRYLNALTSNGRIEYNVPGRSAFVSMRHRF